MHIIKKENKLCLSCMENHEISTVKIMKKAYINNIEIEYEAFFEYCQITDEYTSTEEMIRNNDISMKDAFKKAKGLLTSKEINEIRKQYHISQNDLSTMLGWGMKTITRYESYQIQDMAHNDIMVKLSDDPDWFLTLLERSKNNFSEQRYMKYYAAAQHLYSNRTNTYIKKLITSLCLKENMPTNAYGNTALNIDKLIDTINYIASKNVSVLYLVKLIKMIWYSDALHYKRHETSITGLAYKAMPMGAVPIGYDQMICLDGIHYETKEFGDGIGYLFKSDKNYQPSSLSFEEINTINKIIDTFAFSSKNEIIHSMHNEDSYKKTHLYDIISFDYAKTLSID